MAIQTFELDKGTTFVAGLFWQTLNRPQKLKDEVRQLAGDLDFDFFIIREATIPQVGFLSGSEGAAAGQMSCAAIISKTLDIEVGYGSSLCAIRLPDDRFLFVAIRDGAILPYGDLIGSEEEVERQFLEQLSIGEWPVLVAPSHWGVDGAVERDFPSFLPKNSKGIEYHKWWGVKPVSGSRKQTLMVILVAILISGAGMAGFYGFEQYKSKKLAEETAAQATAMQQQKTEAFANLRVDHPWTSVPQPSDFTAACDGSFKNKYIFAAGWQFESFNCSTSSASYTWIRKETTLASLQSVLPGVASDEMGEKASITIPFAIPQPQKENLWDAGTAKAAFIERMQRIGANFSMTETPVTVPVPPQLDMWADAKPPLPDYQAFHWAIPLTVLRPISVAAFLDIPALRITKVTATLQNGAINWNYEGDIYEKN